MSSNLSDVSELASSLAASSLTGAAPNIASPATAPQSQASPPDKPQTPWSELGLDSGIIRATIESGKKEAWELEAQAIRQVMGKGGDCVVECPTIGGKTTLAVLLAVQTALNNKVPGSGYVYRKLEPRVIISLPKLCCLEEYESKIRHLISEAKLDLVVYCGPTGEIPGDVDIFITWRVQLAELLGMGGDNRSIYLSRLKLFVVDEAHVSRQDAHQGPAPRLVHALVATEAHFVTLVMSRAIAPMRLELATLELKVSRAALMIRPPFKFGKKHPIHFYNVRNTDVVGVSSLLPPPLREARYDVLFKAMKDYTDEDESGFIIVVSGFNNKCLALENLRALEQCTNDGIDMKSDSVPEDLNNRARLFNSDNVADLDKFVLFTTPDRAACHGTWIRHPAIVVESVPHSIMLAEGDRGAEWVNTIARNSDNVIAGYSATLLDPDNKGDQALAADIVHLHCREGEVDALPGWVVSMADSYRPVPHVY